MIVRSLDILCHRLRYMHHLTGISSRFYVVPDIPDVDVNYSLYPSWVKDFMKFMEEVARDRELGTGIQRVLCMSIVRGRVEGAEKVHLATSITREEFGETLRGLLLGEDNSDLEQHARKTMRNVEEQAQGVECFNCRSKDHQSGTGFEPSLNIAGIDETPERILGWPSIPPGWPRSMPGGRPRPIPPTPVRWSSGFSPRIGLHNWIKRFGKRS